MTDETRTTQLANDDASATYEPTPQPRLLALSGPLMGQTLLIQPETVIGRVAGNTIVLTDRAVSRRHTRIVTQGDHHAVEDLGSTNGTWINESRIPARVLTPLVDGCSLRIGRTIFKYRQRVKREDLADEIEDMASRDPETFLYNRFRFMERGREQVERCREANKPLSLLLIYLTDFDAIELEHGDLSADHVLRRVCERVIEQCRVDDTPARIGSRELGILLPHTDAMDAEKLAEEIRRSITESISEFYDGDVSPSIGIGAVMPDDGNAMSRFSTLLVAADQALQQARKLGHVIIQQIGPPTDSATAAIRRD